MVRSMLSESLRAWSPGPAEADGRRPLAAWEIMVATPAIRNLIREDKVAQMYSAIQTGQNTACKHWTRRWSRWSRAASSTSWKRPAEPSTSGCSNREREHEGYRQLAQAAARRSRLRPVHHGDAPPCIKVHGKIKPISTDLLTAEKSREIVLSVMSERQKEEFRNTQELQFAYSLVRKSATG